MKRFKSCYRPEQGDVAIVISDDIQFLPFHKFDCTDLFNWCIQHCTPENAPIGFAANRKSALLIKPKYFEYFSILESKCIRVSSESSLYGPCVWIIHKSDWESSYGCKYAGWFDISHCVYATPGEYVGSEIKNLLKDDISFEFKNGHYLVHHINPIDASSLYPKTEAFLYAGCRNNGKTELIKKILESSNLRLEPFPDYKYDSAAYQSIVASREAMKRAESGDHAVDALSYGFLKGSFWDHVIDEQNRQAREYMLNDIKVTKELIENQFKKENENMKNNTINTTIDEISISQEMGCCSRMLSEVELTLHLDSSDAYRFKRAANDTFTKRGHKPTISINLDDNCGGIVGGFIDLLQVKAEKVIFNNPATIVIWSDGTKTIVKRQKGDRYNKRAGLALCYMKKALGNGTREFNDALKEGLGEE